MARNSVVLGALLTILGAGTFAMVGFDPDKSAALVPAAFGVLILGCGVLALNQLAKRRHMLLTAGFVALFALILMIPGLLQALSLVAGREVANPTAAVEQGITAVLCAVFVGRGVVCLLDSSNQTEQVAERV